jgi:hypothetical protein
MVRIVVTPTWAKLIDFQTTLPGLFQGNYMPMYGYEE